MTRYHISAKGTSAICQAKTEAACPLGGRHFNSKDEANFFIELNPTAVSEHVGAMTNRGLNPPAPKLNPADQLEQSTKSHPSASIRELDDAELEKFRSVLADYNKAAASDDVDAFLGGLEAYAQLQQIDITKLDYSENTVAAELRVNQEIQRRQAVVAVVNQQLVPKLRATAERLEREGAVAGSDTARAELHGKAAAVRHFGRAWAADIAQADSVDGIKTVLVSFDIDQLTPPDGGARPAWQDGLQLARKHVTDYLN